jgi:hypothetical protein
MDEILIAVPIALVFSAAIVFSFRHKWEQKPNPKQLRLLRAIKDLSPDSYGVPLHDALNISFGSLYVQLTDLEDRGWICSCEGAGGPERGFKPRTYWAVTRVGEAVLDREKN